MRIGINCLRSDPDYKGGVNSFTFGLLDGFAASNRGHRFVIFASSYNRHMFQAYEALPNFQIAVLEGRTTRIVRGLFNRIPWQLRLRLPYRLIGHLLNAAIEKRIPKAVDAQYVPYCPTPIFPFPNTPTLYSIHDLQHVYFPDFFDARARRERDIAFGNAVDHAALIQASSRQMADEFVAHFPKLGDRKIVVIPEGVDVSAFAKPMDVDVIAKYRLPDRFLFYPAQLWPHKNHRTIFQALAQLKAEGVDIPLVLTGARYSGSDELTPFLERSAANSIIYLGVVPYCDIIALHRAARFLITASLYEASSIPILEAAAAGTAIIASATPSHSEHSHDLQMQMFAPTDAAALAELLRKVWNDDALIARQTAHNASAIHEFTWAKAAERYLDALEFLALPS